MMKSVRKADMTYLIGKKLFLNTISMREIKIAKNSMPAAALISLSFKTGMLYPSTFSPNCISLLIYLFFLLNDEERGCKNIPVHTHENCCSQSCRLCSPKPLSLTMAKEHCNKSNRQNEMFHNCSFCLILILESLLQILSQEYFINGCAKCDRQQTTEYGKQTA